MLQSHVDVINLSYYYNKKKPRDAIVYILPLLFIYLFCNNTCCIMSFFLVVYTMPCSVCMHHSFFVSSVKTKTEQWRSFSLRNKFNLFLEACVTTWTWCKVSPWNSNYPHFRSRNKNRGQYVSFFRLVNKLNVDSKFWSHRHVLLVRATGCFVH